MPLPSPCIVESAGTAEPRHAVLLGGLLYMMTLYRSHPSAELAERISGHLRLLTTHSETPDSLRFVTASLRARWAPPDSRTPATTGAGDSPRWH